MDLDRRRVKEMARRFWDRLEPGGTRQGQAPNRQEPVRTRLEPVGCFAEVVGREDWTRLRDRLREKFRNADFGSRVVDLKSGVGEVK
jgi:hypothetical protein